MSSIKELKMLHPDEEKAFELIQEGKTDEVIKLIESSVTVRVNCLDKSGMNLLDQACFKGNEPLADFLIARGANVNNTDHDQGYTCLMFAALAGKPFLCQKLLDAGARPHAENSIGKIATELAAFVGQYECVSVINSYISWNDVDAIVHPSKEDGGTRYPREMIDFLHRLTRTHEIHPVRLVFNMMTEPLLVEHGQRIVYTVDRLFEKQLRSKEPNEILSMKLWIILFTLREALKFVKQSRQQEQQPSTLARAQNSSSSSKSDTDRLTLFARNLLRADATDAVRPVEERFVRSAILAFPYKQAMLYQTLARGLKTVEFGQQPSAFLVLCRSLLGHRFVETSHFCLTCGLPSSQKRCKSCKYPYCSTHCQKFDWPNHKKMCETMARRREIDEQLTKLQHVQLTGGRGDAAI